MRDPVTASPAEKRWWERIVGIFEDDPEFEEAMRLGREYRDSLRPHDDEGGQSWPGRRVDERTP
jgi:hypothetical protein